MSDEQFDRLWDEMKSLREGVSSLRGEMSSVRGGVSILRHETRAGFRQVDGARLASIDATLDAGGRLMVEKLDVLRTVLLVDGGFIAVAGILATTLRTFGIV